MLKPQRKEEIDVGHSSHHLMISKPYCNSNPLSLLLLLLPALKWGQSVYSLTEVSRFSREKAHLLSPSLLSHSCLLLFLFFFFFGVFIEWQILHWAFYVFFSYHRLISLYFSSWSEL